MGLKIDFKFEILGILVQNPHLFVYPITQYWRVVNNRRYEEFTHKTIRQNVKQTRL